MELYHIIAMIGGSLAILGIIGGVFVKLIRKGDKADKIIEAFPQLEPRLNKQERSLERAWEEIEKLKSTSSILEKRFEEYHEENQEGVSLIIEFMSGIVKAIKNDKDKEAILTAVEKEIDARTRRSLKRRP